MEHPRPPFSEASRLFRFQSKFFQRNGDGYNVFCELRRTRASNGMYHQKDPRVWISGNDATTTHCRSAEITAFTGQRTLQCGSLLLQTSPLHG